MSIETPVRIKSSERDRMTPQELELLKTISCRDVETFLPTGRTAAQAHAFDALVETLQRMERMGWLEVRAAEQGAMVGRYQRKYVAAVARCTDEGRRVLKMLGED